MNYFIFKKPTYFLFLLTFIFVTLLSNSLKAQDGRGSQGKLGDPSKIPAIGKLTLKVVDGTNNQPLEFATLQINHLRDSTFISGGISDEKGIIQVDQLKLGQLTLRLKFVGFLPYSDTIKMIPPNIEMDIGTIKLLKSERTMKETTILGEKAEMELAIDKKIFNVDKNPIIQGGSALDALKQVPTINVDVDGKISLRGSEGVQVYINGKPSGLNGSNRGSILDQIPASNIQSVEVISNPSAKYDAEGMSGIINIVTKKVLTESKSGSATVGVGTNHKYSATVNFNYSKGRFSISNTLSARYNQNWMEGYNNRDNYGIGGRDFTINQVTNGERKNLASSLSGGMEYRLTDKQSLSLNYTGSLSKKDNPEDIRYNYIDKSASIDQLYYRFTNSEGKNQNIDAGLNYTNYIKKGEKEFNASANYSNSGEEGYGTFRQQNYLKEGVPDSSLPLLQHNNTTNQFQVITASADYMEKLKIGVKLEGGLKSTMRHSDNSQYFDELNYQSNEYNVNPNKTSRFVFDESVYATYINGSYSYKDWGFQSGVRYEYTQQIGKLINTDKGFDRGYGYFFPSLFVKRSFKNKNDFQGSYTRRINRPGSETLNPFTDFSDPLNLRTGNPFVLPELTDAYEITYSKQWERHNLTATGYFRQINNSIQRIRLVDSLGVATVRPENINYAQNIGLEIIGRSLIYNWWTIIGNINVYQNIIKGQLANNANESANLAYGGRVSNNFKIKGWFDAQVAYMLMGPNIFPSGKTKEMQGLDIGIKKDFQSGKYTLNLNCEDVFNTRRFAVTTSDVNFYGTSYRKRETRILRLNFTYKFGKANPNMDEDKKPKKGRDSEGGGDRDMGL